MTQREKFDKFLLEHGVKAKYYSNLDIDFISVFSAYDNVDEFLNGDHDRYLYDAFEWSETKEEVKDEDHMFWSNLNDKWLDLEF